MHIKRLEIQGFKSYKNEAGVEEFSEHHNTIVGRNGSGKSNFFRAIQFVLGEKLYSNLTHKERAELLHEGTGDSALTAHVQIVFDNSVGSRFPIDASEVTLRRTIGLKKDEYFLNNKRTTKTEVANLLESAGFSRSNPYYVVQQGKVNALCLMKDEQRLELLKEVAGTTVYEERRKNSEAILAEAVTKREKIGEAIQYFEGRLQDLNEEKAEFEAFRKLDRKKKALQYTYFEKELQSSTAFIEKYKGIRDQLMVSNQTNEEAAADLSDSREALENTLKESESFLKTISKDYNASRRLHSEHVKEQARAEITLKELEDKKKSIEISAKENEVQLITLTQKIQETEALLESVEVPALDDAQKRLSDLEARRCEVNSKSTQLQAKMSRKKLFTSIEDRNEWLSHRVSTYKNRIESQEKIMMDLQEIIESKKKEFANNSTKIEEIQTSLQDNKKTLQTRVSEHKQLMVARNKAHEDVSRAWQEQKKWDEEFKSAESMLNSGRNAIAKALGGATAAGLQALPDIVADLGLCPKTQVFGPLFELVEPAESSFATAIEVSIRNSFAHVIVDTDETATKIMEELQKRRCGRLTFKPLNRIVERRQQCLASGKNNLNPDTENHDIVGFTEESSSDCFPLISRVRCDPVVFPAVRMILGKILLCRDVVVATEKRKEWNIDCVTLAGEQVNRSGALTGGYYNPKSSKMRIAANIRQGHVAMEGLINQREKLEQQIQQCTALENTVATKVESVKESIQRCTATQHELEEELRSIPSLKSLEQGLREDIAVHEKTQGTLKNFKSEMDALVLELASPMVDILTPEEQVALQEYDKILTELDSSILSAQEEVATRRGKVEKLQRSLELDLAPQRDRLLSVSGKGDAAKTTTSSDYATTNLEDLNFHIEGARVELDQVESKMSNSRARLDDMEKTSSNIQQKIKEYQAEIDLKKAEEERLVAVIRDQEEEIAKISTKLSVQQEKRNESELKIRELGSLPSDELNNYRHYKPRQVEAELEMTNNELLKYSQVNKKALDQFVHFSEKRESLLSNREELDESEASIKELIAHLDMKKDEDIMRTFRGVAKNFAEVFQELVPAGRGELKMITRGSESSENLTVEEFVGVSPKVTFTGEGECFSMRQLSGGQRALVALALIFAIQRCDPAPFYLFDEIDQALDCNHRASVAAMIQRQSQHAQFITTTFRPELVKVADKCFGISFQNKISSVAELKESDAMNFVENVAPDENAGDATATTPGRKHPLRSMSMDSEESEAERSPARTPVSTDSNRKKRVKAY